MKFPVPSSFASPGFSICRRNEDTVLLLLRFLLLQRLLLSLLPPYPSLAYSSDSKLAVHGV